MKEMISILGLLLICANSAISAFTGPQRIVSLGSAITETIDALGKGSDIVATDVTSEYPVYIKKLPKVSRSRSLSVEGLMQYNPDLIIAPEGDISASLLAQLKKLNIKVLNIRQEFSVKGAEKFIMDIANGLQLKKEGEALVQQTYAKLGPVLKDVKTNAQKPLKVLFIYARGAGNMTVAGKGSNMDAIIQLAGAKNAVQEFTDFKSYSTEALVKANPDVLLLFDFGISSLGGKNAILKMPGVKLTNAGKNNRIVEVDGPLMVNFGARLPDAINDLFKKLYE